MNSNIIDLGEIYGLKNNTQNFASDNQAVSNNIPTLEQIITEHNRQMGISQNQTQPQLRTQNQTGVSNGSTAENAIPVDDTTGINPGTTATGTMVPISSPMRNVLGTEEENPQPISEYNQPFLVNAESIQYLNSFVRTQIGRMVQVNFLVGSTNLMTLEGTLLGVGANFLLLNEKGTNDITTCDFYNIKFMRFYY